MFINVNPFVSDQIVQLIHPFKLQKLVITVLFLGN